MHRILMGMALVTASLVAAVPPAAARDPAPFCMHGGRGSTGGALECTYYSWEQCMASRGGGGDTCQANPELGWRAREGGRAPARSKARGQPQRYY
jgi:hypothetical protein